MKRSLRALLFRYMLAAIAVTAVIRLALWGGYQAYEASKGHVVLHEQLNEILLLLLVEVLALAILAFMLGSLSRRVLSPLRSVANAAKSIAQGRLHKRIRTRHLPPGELLDIAQTLNASFDRYQAAIDRLSKFSSAASHQLRTPLTAIRTLAEHSLDQNESPEERSQTLLGILEEVRHLSRMTDQLLLLARLEIEHLREHFTSTDLTALVERVLDLYQPLLESRRIRLHRQFDPPCAILADETLLGEALTNLIDNACKWSPPGGAIRIAIARHDAHATVDVADSGPGIPEAQRAELFQRFHRHPAAPYKGSGLGLSIVSEVARLHGGRIELVPASTDGATFRLTLPLRGNGSPTPPIP